MKNVVTAEIRRLLATRMWAALLLVAAVLGGGLTGAMALIGPENFEPPLTGLDTEAGIRAVLGVIGYTAFVPVIVGVVAATADHRHRTDAVTFLFAPRRWQVPVARLAVHTAAGTAYGTVFAGTAAGALLAVTGSRGTVLGLPVEAVLALLARIGVAMAVYLLIGVGLGTLLHNQVAALAVVIGYLYLGEPLLMMIPGVNVVYPVLPGGATAALTGFTYLADALAAQIGGPTVHLLPPAAGAAVLVAYAVASAALAVVIPLRRDIT